MIEYKIIKGSDYGSGMPSFEKQINEAINNGWDLQGGVSITKDASGYHTYVQAVVKVNYEREN